MTGAALGYIAGEHAKARKTGGKGCATKSLAGDGSNQPRLFPLHVPVRGIELDDQALDSLAASKVCDEYLEAVRMPQAAATCDALLTLRHHRFGGLRLGGNPNPIVKATSTVVRVCSFCHSMEWAHAYFAINGTTAINCQSLSVHVDGASRKKEPTAELLQTRWAHVLRGGTHASRRARLDAARALQPLLGMSLWLRRGLAVDVAPCSGLAISAPAARGTRFLQPSLACA
jgi:hypothetical protein